jgi:KDO2-lipid IV(A) lauroyltransferase
VQALLDVRPKVLVTGHYGNFELGSFINGRLGFPTFTVARTLDNPYLDKYINKFRSANGQFMLPKKGSSAQVQAVLEAGYALGLVGDQHAGPKGCWVDFLGRPASCHKAIAVLTLTSGAPLIVLAGTRRRPLHFTAHLLGIVDPAKNDPECASIETLTQWYNDCLAKVIRAHPEQYWWVHRRWKGTPPKRYAARRKAA